MVPPKIGDVPFVWNRHSSISFYYCQHSDMHFERRIRIRKEYKTHDILQRIRKESNTHDIFQRIRKESKTYENFPNNKEGIQNL